MKDLNIEIQNLTTYKTQSSMYLKMYQKQIGQKQAEIDKSKEDHSS